MKIGSALRKDFVREIRNNIGRFLSIFFIVLLGVAFFAGLKASAPDMEHSMDAYFDEYNIMDIQVMSTLGLTADDMVAISEVEGVREVQAGRFVDATSFHETEEVVYRIHGLQGGYSSAPEEYVNQIKILEGRLPQSSGEIVIEESSTVASRYNVGDYITFYSGTDAPITEENLTTDTFLVVGKAVTPYYLSYEKGPSTLASGSVNFFAYILDSDFKFDYYTEALVTVEGAAKYEMYSKKYENLVNSVMENIEEISDERCTIRANSVRDAAEAALADAKQQYEDGLAEFEAKIAEAEKTLSDAYDELIQGEMALEVGRQSFEEQYASSMQQINETESQIREMEENYGGYVDAAGGLMETIDGYVGTAEGYQDDFDSSVDDAQHELDEINAILEAGGLDPDTEAQYRDLAGRYEEFISGAQTASNGMSSFLNGVSGFTGEVNGGIKDVKSAIANAKRQLADAKEQLALAKEQAEAEFAEAEQQIAEGWISYNEGVEELERQKAEGQKQLDDAYAQLILAEEMINKIDNPMWYVLDRNSNYGFVDYKMTCDRIDSIAKIFPVFFYLVAALVCSTTMTRMIDEQRGIIGTYKALGYSNLMISFKYVAYAGIASIAGGVIGVILGVIFFPYTVYYAWSAMYTLPQMRYLLQIPLMLISVIIGVAVSGLTAYFTCQKELIETPAMMMRPKAPKAGKVILLEKIKFLWSALSFSQKVTARNIFRYKKRFWMTVIGIAGCAALLLAGFGLSNSVNSVVERQFGDIFRYDISISFTTMATDEEKEEIRAMLYEEDSISRFTGCANINATGNTGGDNIAFTLVVPNKDSLAEFPSYVVLRDRASKTEFSLPENGIVLTELLAKELGVSVGDTISVTNALDLTRQVEVAAITEHYLFHYAYMNPDSYKDIFNIPAEDNGLLVELAANTGELKSALSSKFMHYPQIGSTSFYSTYADQMTDSIDSINLVVYIIIICAALLAFIVLYNLTNINVSERTREIATLKVLGFTNKEVYTYVYRENFILTAVGELIGLVAGVFLHRFIMDAIEQDNVMFGYHLETYSFFVVFLMTMLFSVIVSFVMRKRLDDIDMVESLKSIE